MTKEVQILCCIFFLIFYDCSYELIDEESTTPSQYTLTITASEGGTLSPDANGIYNEGAKVTFRAIPDEGYMFDRWEGTDNKGCGWVRLPHCRGGVTMNSDRDVKVFFKKITVKDQIP